MLLRIGIVVAVTAAGFGRVQAEAPLDVTSSISIEVAIAETKAHVAALEKLVQNPEQFAEVDEEELRQVAGMVAVFGQVLVEHKKGKSSGIAAAALRDAALKLRPGKPYEAAAAALKQVQAAMQGQGEGAAKHPWNKLIGMYPMMEEMNARQAKTLRAARRPRRPLEDSGHAATLAVLAIAMYADTHEVKNEADIAEWQRMSKEYHETMVKLAAALNDKDADAAKPLAAKGAKSCGACHEKFRD